MAGPAVAAANASNNATSTVSDGSGIAPQTFVELFVGDADTTAGSAGADAFWRWLAGHPAARKHYVVIRSRPGFVANHDSAQRSDPLARRIFWGPFDRLVEQARRSG